MTELTKWEQGVYDSGIEHGRKLAEAEIAKLRQDVKTAEDSLQLEKAARISDVNRERRLAEGMRSERNIMQDQVMKAEAERDALGDQLEYDRTLVAECVTTAKKAVQSRDWLTEGRGTYEWDDDKWHTEFAYAATEFLQAVEPMTKVAADWTGCPQTAEQVARARINLKARLAEVWPETMPPALRHILSLMCFQFIGTCEAYRKAGFDIERAAEAEQAFMLHRLIGLWFKHGDEWVNIAKAELKEMRSAGESTEAPK